LRARFQTLIPHPSVQPPVAEEDPHALSQLSYKGHHLFNSLPQNIRNLTECDVTTFKEALDKFLQTKPDQPLLHILTQLGVCDTSSVDDWVSRLMSAGVDTERHRRGNLLATRTFMPPWPSDVIRNLHQKYQK